MISLLDTDQTKYEEQNKKHQTFNTNMSYESYIHRIFK